MELLLGWFAFVLEAAGMAVLFWPSRRPLSHYEEERGVFLAGFACAVGCGIVGMFVVSAGEPPLSVLAAGVLAGLAPLWLHLARRYRSRQLFGDLDIGP